MEFKSKKFFLLFVILLIALSLRVYGINYSLPTEERMNYYFPGGLQDASHDQMNVFCMLGTAFPDEADMLGIISHMNPSKLDFNPHHFAYGGCLHFFTTALLLKIASLLNLIILTPIKKFYFINPQEFAKMLLVGRAMIVMFGVASVYMVYRIAKSLYDEKTGILSALFLSILPIHVLLSYIMIPDIPVIFWMILALYCCINLFRTKKLKWYIFTGIVSGLSGATKSDGLLLIFPIITAHLISVMGNKRQSFKNYLFSLFDRRLIICFVTMVLVVIVVGNPYIVVSFKETVDHFLHRSPHLVGTEFLPPTPLAFLKNITKNMFNRSAIFLIMELGNLLPFMLAGLVYALYKRSKSDILLLGLIVPFYIAVSGLKWCSPDYLLPIIPFAVILIARFLVQAIGSDRIVKYSGLLIWLLVFVITFDSVFVSVKNNSLMAQKDTRMEAAEWIRNNIPAGSTIGLTVDARDDQYCTAPPLSKSRYKIKVIEYEFNQKGLLGADYIILTDILQMQMLPEVSKKFREVKSFIKTPKIFGIYFNRKHVSDLFMNSLMKLHKRIYRNTDWMQPDIRIFKNSI